MSEDRFAIGYDHGYDGEVFYPGPALDPAYVEGFVEGCLNRWARTTRTKKTSWEDGDERAFVLERSRAG